MRAFIAVEISDQMRGAIARVEEHLKYAGADVKWVRPELVHLTLKFLGDIDEKRAGEVSTIIDDIARARSKFEITAKDIGAFPRIEHPRVIWVGLDKGAAETAGLAAAVEEALAGIGFKKEERPFSPHLTIGRVRSPLNKDKLKEKVVSAAESFHATSISPHTVTSIILFRSTLTPQGPIYTRIHESPLSA